MIIPFDKGTQGDDNIDTEIPMILDGCYASGSRLVKHYKTEKTNAYFGEVFRLGTFNGGLAQITQNPSSLDTSYMYYGNANYLGAVVSPYWTGRPRLLSGVIEWSGMLWYLYTNLETPTTNFTVIGRGDEDLPFGTNINTTNPLTSSSVNYKEVELTIGSGQIQGNLSYPTSNFFKSNIRDEMFFAMGKVMIKVNKTGSGVSTAFSLVRFTLVEDDIVAISEINNKIAFITRGANGRNILYLWDGIDSDIYDKFILENDRVFWLYNVAETLYMASFKNNQFIISGFNGKSFVPLYSLYTSYNDLLGDKELDYKVIEHNGRLYFILNKITLNDKVFNGVFSFDTNSRTFSCVVNAENVKDFTVLDGNVYATTGEVVSNTGKYLSPIINNGYASIYTSKLTIQGLLKKLSNVRIVQGLDNGNIGVNIYYKTEDDNDFVLLNTTEKTFDTIFNNINSYALPLFKEISFKIEFKGQLKMLEVNYTYDNSTTS